jgi:hypothetical protein
VLTLLLANQRYVDRYHVLPSPHVDYVRSVGCLEIQKIASVTDDEAKQVLDKIQGIANQTTSSLDALVGKADKIKALGPIGTNLVNQDLSDLNISADNLADDLISKATVSSYYL